MIKQIVWLWQQKKSQRHRGKEAQRQRSTFTAAQRQRSTEAKKHRGTEAKKRRGKEAQRHRGKEAQRQRSTEAKTLRTSFSATAELFLIEGSCLFIIFDFQQLLLLTNFDQTHRYGDRTITSHQCSHFTTCSLSH